MLTSSPWQGDNILVLDHLNINHESGRHDLLKVLYKDCFVYCSPVTGMSVVLQIHTIDAHFDHPAPF